jgi:pilus assembly protein FimV
MRPAKLDPAGGATYCHLTHVVVDVRDLFSVRGAAPGGVRLAINRDKVEAQAIKLLQAGKLDKAILELKKLIEDDPADVRTLLKLGDTYVKMGNKKESIESYEKAASIYTEQGFYLKAVAVYKQILRVDANLPALHLKLAELYQQLSLTSDAIQHYQQVAVAYEHQGKAKESLDILKRMVDLDPDNLASRIKLGELFAAQGLPQEAVAELRRALEFLKQQQRYDDYVRVGEKLVVFDPGATDVARELAQIYMQRGQANIALSKLQLCFKADPRNVEVLALIAQAFLDMQQVPKTVSVYKEMAKIYAADGNTALSQRTWERVLELVPGDEEAEQALGQTSTAPRPTLVPTVVAPAMANAPMRSAPVTNSGSAQRSAEDEQLMRLLTETDVYVKYGLKDKAIEHLQKVFEVRRDYVPALEKLKTLQQSQGGPAYVDALRRLVDAAQKEQHPRAEEWQRELSSLSAARPAAPPLGTAMMAPVASRSSSGEGDFVAIDDNAPPDEPLEEGAFFTDDAPPDEPLVAPQAALPPDEPSAPDEAAFADKALEIPRMPTGVLPAPARPAAPPEPPPLELDEVDPTGSAEVMRAALQHVSDEMMDEVMSSEFVLEPSSEFQLADEAEQELKTGPGMPRLQSLTSPGPPPARDSSAASVDEDELDRMAREALAEHITAPAAKAAPLPAPVNELVPTAMNQLSSDELDEIAEFEGGTSEPSPPRPRPAPLPPELERGEGFDDPTLALLPPKNSSDMPTDERPRRVPTVPQPLVSASSDESGAQTAVAPSLAGMRQQPPSPSLASRPEEMQPAAAPPPTFDAVSDEFDPSKFDLPPEVKELLRKPAPVPEELVDTTPVDALKRPAAAPSSLAAPPKAPPPRAETSGGGTADFDSFSDDVTLRGVDKPKLQFADKQQGFENDPANQFFPDELEECEFFIQQELYDEAKEILTNILDDVPESARVQWMLARIEARENGQPEPPAPWEQRILEEVQAQLETLGIAESEEKLAEKIQEETQQVSVEEVLSQFKQKVAEVIPEEDAATHYDLGNAYRDMGLLDDAINEFLIAARAPAKAADAKFLIGKTRVDQGRFDEALAAFGEALTVAQATPRQRGAAEYERGVCLEQLGRGADALRAFRAAKGHGHDAIDIDRRIKALADKHGDGENGANGHDKNGAGHGGDRPAARSKNIDYL